MENLYEVGHKVFKIIADASYWIFAIVILIDIVKKFTARNMEGCVKSLLQGAIGFACIYSITLILDLVRDVFSGL